MVFIEVCSRFDIDNNNSKLFKINDKEIAIFNNNNKFYAINNTCPHQGGSLSEGEIHQDEVSCPSHCWMFNIKSGECLNVPSAKVKTYNIKVENEKILLNI